MENKTDAKQEDLNITTPSVTNSHKILFMSNKIKRVKNWTPEEDEVLIDIANKYNCKNWKAIAHFFEDRTPIQCSARFKRTRPGIIKGPWTIGEDKLLDKLIKEHGTKNWSLLAKFMPSRSGKQIRDRYLNALDPRINKDKFTLDEDKKILELYTRLGTSWTKIAKSFKGRTGDLIKNRFYSSLRRKIHSSDQIKTKLVKPRRMMRLKTITSLSDSSNNFYKLEQDLKKGIISISYLSFVY